MLHAARPIQSKYYSHLVSSVSASCTVPAWGIAASCWCAPPPRHVLRVYDFGSAFWFAFHPISGFINSYFGAIFSARKCCCLREAQQFGWSYHVAAFRFIRGVADGMRCPLRASGSSDECFEVRRPSQLVESSSLAALLVVNNVVRDLVPVFASPIILKLSWIHLGCQQE